MTFFARERFFQRSLMAFTCFLLVVGMALPVQAQREPTGDWWDTIGFLSYAPPKDFPQKLESYLTLPEGEAASIHAILKEIVIRDGVTISERLLKDYFVNISIDDAWRKRTVFKVATLSGVQNVSSYRAKTDSDALYGVTISGLEPGYYRVNAASVPKKVSEEPVYAKQHVMVTPSAYETSSTASPFTVTMTEKNPCPEGMEVTLAPVVATVAGKATGGSGYADYSVVLEDHPNAFITQSGPVDSKGAFYFAFTHDELQSLIAAGYQLYAYAMDADGKPIPGVTIALYSGEDLPGFSSVLKLLSFEPTPAQGGAGLVRGVNQQPWLDWLDVQFAQGGGAGNGSDTTTPVSVTTAPVTVASGGRGASSYQASYSVPVNPETNYVSTPAGAPVIMAGLAYSTSDVSSAFTTPLQAVNGALVLAVLPQLPGGQAAVNVVLNKVSDQKITPFSFKPTVGGGVPPDAIRYMLTLTAEALGKDYFLSLNLNNPDAEKLFASYAPISPVSATDYFMITLFAGVLLMLGITGLVGSSIYAGVPVLKFFTYGPLALISLLSGVMLVLALILGFFY